MTRRDAAATGAKESAMTHITMDGANRGSSPGFAGRPVLALMMAVQSRYGRWRRMLGR